MTAPAAGARPAASWRPPRRGRWLASAASALGLLLVACGDGAPGGAAGGAAGGGAGGAPPPPQVGVVQVQLEAVALQTELPGRVEALRTAQVRARVGGVVQQRVFREGSDVRAGEVLMRIDPAPYRAALASAQAQLQRAEANLAQATRTAERYRPLAEIQAVSQQQAADAEGARSLAEADVAAARAALQTAQLNLGYATVTAPIAGRIGRALVTEGALVSAAEATPLAVIQQTNRVYVNFTQSSAELLRLQRALASGELRASNGGAVPVRVVLEDGTELPRPGRLLFSDLTVDAGTGQVTLRAEVPNPDGLLLPGQYVRVRLAPATLPAAVLLPQQAVTRTAQGDTVMVVGAENKPETRRIAVSGAQNGQWVVTQGLQAGEQVIVDGFQKMFAPGAPVSPVPWAPPSAANSGAGSGPGAAAGGQPAGPSAAVPGSERGGEGEAAPAGR